MNGIGGACGIDGIHERCIHVFFVERSEGKRPLGKPRPKCYDNIKIDLQEVGCCYEVD